MEYDDFYFPGPRKRPKLCEGHVFCMENRYQIDGQHNREDIQIKHNLSDVLHGFMAQLHYFVYLKVGQ